MANQKTNSFRKGSKKPDPKRPFSRKVRRKIKIYITGSKGLVGSRFVELLPEKFFPLTPEINELDITNKLAVERFIAREKPEIIVNFAAFTNVDRVEKEKGNKKGLAWQVNVEGAKNIAEVAKKNDRFLVHISTDFVFPGTKGPYSEDSKLPKQSDKIGWYGWTKLMAEKRLKEVGGRVAIARISYPYRAFYQQKLDFARNILTLLDEGKLYPLFSDQVITPTFIDEACRALIEICQKQKQGIYHLVSSNTTTPYEFASYLLEKARGVKDIVEKGSIREFLKTPERTPRPILGGLKTDKTQKELKMKFMTWQEGIDEFIKQLS
jgi:dTDP-4-dehydrorhamnose reductase